jgi:hypothetical protein
MRHTKEVARWGIFEWIVTLLLTTCAALLAACAVLAWFYLPAVGEINSSVVAKNEKETGLAIPIFQRAAGPIQFKARRDQK